MKSENGHRFGEILRAVRERRGITLKQVAGKVGVSESLISQIERNKVSPSVDTLINIADTLEIDLEYLFRDYKRKKNVTLVTPEERTRRVFEGVTYEHLTTLSDPVDEYSMEALMLTLDGNTSRGDKEYGHRGRELGIILEGTAQLSYGDKQYDLKAGDCVSFDSDIPHNLSNSGSAPLRAVWIITPPKNAAK
jgi:transcriptional regulator with XRE-family HTH domain